LNFLGLIDPDDESIISFRSVWSYSSSDSVRSKKNGSEGNYVGVQKKRVFFVYPHHRETTRNETVGFVVKTGQFFFRFSSICCLVELFNRHFANSKVGAETARGIFPLRAEAERVFGTPDQPVKGEARRRVKNFVNFNVM
jgi:hypothetical protein